jgi:hypothetical protein
MQKESTVFWYMKSCNLLYMYWCLGKTCCLHLLPYRQKKQVPPNCQYKPPLNTSQCMVSQLKRQHSSTVQPYCPRTAVPFMNTICSWLCSQVSVTRYPRQMYSIPKFNIISLRNIFMLSFYLCLDFPGGFFYSGFLSKIYAFWSLLGVLHVLQISAIITTWN